MSAHEQLEEILFQCLESEDFEVAIESACSTHASLSGEIRRLAESIRMHGLLMTEQAGQPRELGGHELREKLGEGGMGVIYRALQQSTGREVALKILRPELHFFDKSRARFQREVEAVARLSHPAIVPVFDAGEDNGVPFFTMEYVRGASLATVLHWLRDKDASTLRGEDIGAAVADISDTANQGAWDGSFVRQVMRAFVDLGHALAHAHECGVLHRDLKPSNILLRGDGRAQLLDFGLASLAGSERLSGSGPLGTPAYMAPELLSDGAQIPNPRFDVYGLGLVLYETLTLEQPFLANGAEATRQRILRHEVPSLRKRNAQVPWDLEIVCKKAIAREPEERYAEIADLAEDLENVLGDRPIRAQRPSVGRLVQRWARRRATPLLAVGSALMVALIASVWLLLHERDTRNRIEQALYRSKIAIAVGNLSRGLTAEARLALDECPEHLRGWEWHHQRLLADATEAVITEHEPLNHSIAISPDGRLLASCGSKCVRITDLETGALQHEFQLADTSKLCFAGDGRYVAVSTTGPRFVIYDVVSGRIVRELAERARYPASHGDILAYGSNSGGVKLAKLSDGEALRTVQAHTTEIHGLAVSKDGTTCVTAADGRVRLWSFPAFERLAEWKTRYGLVSDLCFAGDSATVMVASSDVRSGRVGVERFSNGRELPALPAREVGTHVAVSGDGENIAIGSSSISLRHGKGRPFANVHGISAHVVDMEYSPDGRKIYVMCNDGSVRRFASIGSAANFEIPIGLGVIRRLATVDAQHVACASSSGRIAVVDLRTRRVIARADGPGGRIEGLVALDETLFVVARDGDWAQLALPSLEPRASGRIPSAATAADAHEVVSATRFGEGMAVALAGGEIHVWRDHVWSRAAEVEGCKVVTGDASGRLFAVTASGRIHGITDGDFPVIETGLDGVLAVAIVDGLLWLATNRKQLAGIDLATGTERLRRRDLRRNISAIGPLLGTGRWFYSDWAGDITVHEIGEIASLMRADLSHSMLLAATADAGGDWIAAAGLAGSLYVLTARR